MNPYRSSAVLWTTEKPKDLYFTSWFLVDHKGSVFCMLLLSAIVLGLVWLHTGIVFSVLFAALIILLTLGQVFFPTYYELNTEGIVRRSFVRKRLISWEDIRSYEIRSNGILLLPGNDRFFLDFFRADFLPVPNSLIPEVLYRFRVFVDRIQD